MRIFVPWALFRSSFLGNWSAVLTSLSLDLFKMLVRLEDHADLLDVDMRWEAYKWTMVRNKSGLVLLCL